MRLLLFYFLFFLTFNTIQAQRFDGGIMAGVVSSQLDGDHRSGYDKFGVVCGGFVNTRFNKQYGLQMEIKFIQKGSKGKDTLGGGFSYYASKLNYIEIPVLINYIYKEKYMFELGLGAGYLVSAVEDKDGYGYEKADPEFNKFEIAGTAGFSYIISEQLIISSRFIYSVLPVRADYTGAVRYIDRGQYNNVLTLAFFYKFKKAS